MGDLSTNLGEANTIQNERMLFDKDAFSQRMVLENWKMAQEDRKMALDEMTKVRELKKDLETLEDDFRRHPESK